MTQKIIISGFSHCGTSILKSIIGHIKDVEEIYEETNKINIKSNKKYILCKYPQILSEFLGEDYKDYIKIFIIRNPLFIYSSINRRNNSYNLSKYHSIKKYVEVVKTFIKYNDKPEKNIYTIKYEDVFDNNFSALKKILDDIGFEYDDIIFDNTKYTNYITEKIPIPTDKPLDTDHKNYRTWQINQPFILNNDIKSIDLSDTQIKEIINNEYILKLYPEIKSMYS